MKKFLAISFVIITIASFLVFFNPHQANAVPVSYNLTSLSVPFTNYTRASANNFDVFIEPGYNGTVTSLYQGRNTNNTLNYEFGYHPTLPLTIDTFNNITASASVAATQSLPITIASGHNNVVLLVGISFDHTANTDHNSARMSSVAIGANSFTLIQNKTVTCGAAACDSEMWVLGNNTALTGAQTITITPASVTNYHMVAGVYSLYNVRSIRPYDAPATNTGTSVKPTITTTPVFTSAWLVDNLFSLQTTSPTGNATQKWIGKTAAIMGASQVITNPILNAANTLTYTTTNVQWINNIIEVIPIQNQKNFGYNLAWDTIRNNNLESNSTNVYYAGRWSTGVSNELIQHINVNTGVETHDFSLGPVGGGTCSGGNTITTTIFAAQQFLVGYCNDGAGGFWKTTLSGGNSSSLGTNLVVSFVNNEKIKITSIGGDYFNSNNTASADSRTTSNQCELTYMPSNTTTPIDNIACDGIFPNHVAHYWNGMYIYRIGNYYTNSTLNFLTNIDSSSYKKQLTIPALIYGIPDTDVRAIGHWSGKDWLISVNAVSIQYTPLPNLTTLLGQNRAFQTYDLTLVTTDNHFFLSPSSVSPVTSIKLYGQNGLFLNVTTSKYGMIGLPSGYSMRTTALAENIIRTVDPRWTNTPSQDFPAIATTASNFPIVLTVSNAPTDAALWLSNGAQVINNVNSVWCLTQLDTTHTAECDIPPNQCANVYVADISVAPTIYNYEGNVCATGTNQKTIAYTNTLPLSFYTMNYAATSSYTPSTNGLQTTVRATVTPFTYNVLIKNSTGAITQNFTKTIAGTIDTHTFNVTNATKPASLYISVVGTGQIYSSYLGSSLTLASVSSFFHQYFSYQGFDLLSFIPIIFASMFTRNTVGIGTALTVVCIASLSWLSIVVIPDNYIIIMIVVAIMAMIGYRGIYG